MHCCPGSLLISLWSVLFLSLSLSLSLSLFLSLDFSPSGDGLSYTQSDLNKQVTHQLDFTCVLLFSFIFTSSFYFLYTLSLSLSLSLSLVLLLLTPAAPFTHFSLFTFSSPAEWLNCSFLSLFSPPYSLLLLGSLVSPLFPVCNFYSRTYHHPHIERKKKEKEAQAYTYWHRHTHRIEHTHTHTHTETHRQ